MLLAGRETWYENDFKAEEIYKIWNKYCSKNCPKLLEKIEVKNIYFPYKLGEFYGLDYIKKEDYEKHLLIMEKTPDDFLHNLNNNRIGTLETLDLLIEAGSDKKALATTWMLAFCLTVKEDLPEKWRGKIYGAIKGIEKELYKVKTKKEIYWSRGTKKHLPEMLYSDYIYENIKIDTLEQLIEIIALNCAYILDEYYIVNYYSTEKRKIK